MPPSLIVALMEKNSSTEFDFFPMCFSCVKGLLYDFILLSLSIWNRDRKQRQDQKMKGIVSFDMDMTLLDHSNYKIPESALRAIEKLRERYYIVIATGRDLDSRFSAGLREMVEPDAVIHLNGTKITVGDELIYEHHMDPDNSECSF